VDATTIVYFIAMIYMYAAAIRLAYRKDRYTTPNAVLIPGKGRSLDCEPARMFVVLGGIALSFIPPAESLNKVLFVAKLIIRHGAVRVARARTVLSRCALESSRHASKRLAIPVN